MEGNISFTRTNWYAAFIANWIFSVCAFFSCFELAFNGFHPVAVFFWFFIYSFLISLFNIVVYYRSYKRYGTHMLSVSLFAMLCNWGYLIALIIEKKTPLKVVFSDSFFILAALIINIAFIFLSWKLRKLNTEVRKRMQSTKPIGSA